VFLVYASLPLGVIAMKARRMDLEFSGPEAADFIVLKLSVWDRRPAFLEKVKAQTTPLRNDPS
jgi:hypothetical protein